MTKTTLKKRMPLFFSLTILTLATSAWMALRKASFPEPTGPYGVGAYQLELLDTTWAEAGSPSGRKLLVQLYYPAMADPKATTPYTPHPLELEQDLQTLYGIPKPLLRKLTRAEAPVQTNADAIEDDRAFPLLIFSHGNDGTRFQNSFLLPELASQGYLIASIEHTGAASGTVFRDGTRGQTIPMNLLLEDEPFSIRQIEKWSRDQIFVLDQLTALYQAGNLPFRQSWDPGRVGAFGHSFGGATSAATLTRDPRFRAGANMDGFYFGEAYRVGFDQPFLELRADNKPPEAMTDKDLKEWQMTREEYRRFLFVNWKERIESYARNGYESHTLRHANHMSFSDFTLLMPFSFLTAPHRQAHHELTTHLVLDFFNRHLKQTAPTEPPAHLVRYLGSQPQ